MPKIDFNQVYKERIEQINLDVKVATRDKKWTQVAKLQAERAKLEEYIKE